MRVVLAGLGFAMFLGACGASPAAEPTSMPATPTSAQATKGRHDELVGRWSPTLPPREARAVVTARAALADPPNDAALEAMNPSAEDRATYKHLLELRAADERGAQISTVRKRLADYEEMLVEITPSSIGWRTPGAPEVRQGYRVLAEDGDSVTIAAKDEQLDVRFLDKDHISMRGSTKTFLLTRDSAVAADAKSPVAAWNGPTTRPGRDGSGSASSSVVPGPGAPAATGRARDACSAYADCIDEMPRLKGTEGVMGASSSTIRSWERTPENLRQCASALELAHAGALCR